MFNVKSTVLEKRTGKMLNSVLGNYIRETGISCVTNSTYKTFPASMIVAITRMLVS